MILEHAVRPGEARNAGLRRCEIRVVFGTPLSETQNEHGERHVPPESDQEDRDKGEGADGKPTTSDELKLRRDGEGQAVHERTPC